MHFALVSIFPQMFAALSSGGVVAQALERGIIQLSLWNPRDYSHNKHRSVDDRPYGGGAGMVMQVQPLRAAIRAAQAQRSAYVIYLSPQGKRCDQSIIQTLLEYESLLLVAGRYEGIDQRIVEHDIDLELSIGDYVLSGGELAAMVLIDAITRQLPGVLGHADSALADSFYAGLLDYPHYTRPECIDGQSVPAVLLSGDHQAIARWRQKQALGHTWQRRPDLLAALTPSQQLLLDEFISELEVNWKNNL